MSDGPYVPTDAYTLPYGAVEEADAVLTERRAFPVHVVSSSAKPVKPIGTEYGQFRTVVVANTVGQDSATPGAKRLLNRNLRRRRAHIIVSPSVVAQAVTDGVIIGSREAIASGLPMTIGNVGGYLPIGTSMRYECQAEVWVSFPVSNTNTVYVTVCDEVYASDPEEE
jgi:hypothetical protein